MLLSIIPVVDLWAAYRIEKLRLWILLWIGLTLISFTLEGIGDFTTQFVIGLIIDIPISVFLMRHFTMDWNKKIDETNSQNQSFSQDNDSLGSEPPS